MADRDDDRVQPADGASLATDAEADADGNGAGPAPPGEAETWRWLQSLIQEAERGRQRAAHDDAWDEAHRMFWGDQWGDLTLPSWKPPIVVNELKTYLLTEISELTDLDIKLYVHKDRVKGERVQAVERALQAEWQRHRVNEVLAQAMLYAMIYPAGFIGCFVRERPDGTRDLDIRAIHPEQVYPDPDATSDEDWTYVLIKEVVDLRALRQEFPERARRVQPEARYSEPAGDPARRPWWQAWRRRSGGYLGPLSTPAAAGTPLSGWLKARVAKYTLFLLDDTEELGDPEVVTDDRDEPLLDESGNPTVRVPKRRKYPNGRQLVAANGVILYDDPYQYLGPFPLIRVVAEPTTGEFWLPKSPVAGVQALFQAANKLDSLLVENAIRLNNAVVIADASTGLRPRELAAMPGQLILKGPGEIKFQTPPPFPESMTKIGSFFRELGARVLGFPPGRLAQGTRGNVSAELTETEISQAMGLTRLRARMLYEAATKLAQQMFWRLAQYQATPRAIITPTGEAIPWEPIAPDEILSYEVQVDPAAFMLRSKAMLQRLVLLLARMGKVSTAYALRILDLPDAETEALRAQREVEAALWMKQQQTRRASTPLRKPKA